jgi:hypothetical protein
MRNAEFGIRIAMNCNPWLRELTRCVMNCSKLHELPSALVAIRFMAQADSWSVARIHDAEHRFITADDKKRR